MKYHDICDMSLQDHQPIFCPYNILDTSLKFFSLYQKRKEKPNKEKKRKKQNKIFMLINYFYYKITKLYLIQGVNKGNDSSL